MGSFCHDFALYETMVLVVWRQPGCHAFIGKLVLAIERCGNPVGGNFGGKLPGAISRMAQQRDFLGLFGSPSVPKA